MDGKKKRVLRRVLIGITDAVLGTVKIITRNERKGRGKKWRVDRDRRSPNRLRGRMRELETPRLWGCRRRKPKNRGGDEGGKVFLRRLSRRSPSRGRQGGVDGIRVILTAERQLGAGETLKNQG